MSVSFVCLYMINTSPCSKHKKPINSVFCGTCCQVLCQRNKSLVQTDNLVHTQITIRLCINLQLLLKIIVKRAIKRSINIKLSRLYQYFFLKRYLLFVSLNMFNTSSIKWASCMIAIFVICISHIVSRLHFFFYSLLMLLIVSITGVGKGKDRS